MDHTIKRTVTITITETWTIVWTADQASERVGKAQPVQPTTQDQVSADSLIEEQGVERSASSPTATDQQPGALPVRATPGKQRKRGRGRRAKDKQDKPTDESQPNP
ncbi:MAG: hypothetical protein R3C14_49015 [Caldilineaceae bacterium]